ncbi:hypothetical protein ACFFQF_20390 [Haladaptatus pallidirubidus]|uniref:Uncharacterized protein n=1 Tax=Haladaptatus pallidirubidus TaxID=1008152 RepID=A0AAV3UQQ6_9EURY|nr:hypothetical protein [Haladaptatus pallidirubidus]
MKSRIADIFRREKEHNEELSEEVEEVMNHALQDTEVSVSDSSVYNNRISVDIDLTKITERLNECDEFDGMVVAQKIPPKFDIKKDYRPDGGQEGNGHPN